MGLVSPASADSFEDWVTVSGGGFHSCGARANGKLYCWGDNAKGEVGDGTRTNRSRPTRIGAFEDWTSVTGGREHTCGIRHGGKLYCWGSNSSGQVGNGATETVQTTPTRTGAFVDWTVASAGYRHTCGIRHGGELYCWGANDIGQIGDGTATIAGQPTPERVGAFNDWMVVDGGAGHTCGIRRNGEIYCWGWNTSGEVGDGTVDHRLTPTQIGSETSWRSVSAGGAHTCATRTDGTLYCWGRNQYGQVGDGDHGNLILSPERIGTFEDWVTVSAGGDHTCGVRRNGKLYCWGRNEHGRVGDGTTTDRDQPTRIGSATSWASVSAGGEHTCGTRTSGKLYCWGYNKVGQVGDGTTSRQYTPGRV